VGHPFSDEPIPDERTDVLGEMTPVDTCRLHDARLRQLARHLGCIRVAGEVEEMKENPFFGRETDRT